VAAAVSAMHLVSMQSCGLAPVQAQALGMMALVRLLLCWCTSRFAVPWLRDMAAVPAQELSQCCWRGSAVLCCVCYSAYDFAALQDIL
jgi:hypothetical protein